MRATNIKFMLGLKKMGQKILFKDCPQCKRFFGTDETSVETCSIDCDIKYALRDQSAEMEKKNRRDTILKARVFIQN